MTGWLGQLIANSVEEWRWMDGSVVNYENWESDPQH